MLRNVEVYKGITRACIILRNMVIVSEEYLTSHPATNLKLSL